MVEFIDKTTEQSGTPINRENLMAMQGFGNKNIVIDEENMVITETNLETNHTLTTSIVENPDGSTTITEVFAGEKTITKTTTIGASGNLIDEVIK